MDIATFNVNGVNGRLESVLLWPEEPQPDAACLQELKAPQDQKDFLDAAGLMDHVGWDRCRVGLSAGRAGAPAMPPPPNRRTTRRKRAQPSGPTAVAAWVTTRGRLAYNKRGPRLQQAPLCLFRPGSCLCPQPVRS